MRSAGVFVVLGRGKVCKCAGNRVVFSPVGMQ